MCLPLLVYSQPRSGSLPALTPAHTPGMQSPGRDSEYEEDMPRDRNYTPGDHQLPDQCFSYCTHRPLHPEDR